MVRGRRSPDLCQKRGPTSELLIWVRQASGGTKRRRRRAEPARIRDIGQQTGKVYVNFFGDAFARLEDGESLYRLASRWLADLPSRKVGAYFFARDPVPGFRNLLAQFRRIGSALRRRLRHTVPG